MKNIFFSLTFCLAGSFTLAQEQPDTTKRNRAYPDSAYTGRINNINIFSTDSFNNIVQRKIDRQKIKIPAPYDQPKVYFINQRGNEYLKIYGGPDIGYNWFFTIGYTTNRKCNGCGTFLGTYNSNDFTANNNIKLGDDIKQVWGKAHLEYFRRFSFNGIGYFYFERGTRHDIPFTPDQIYYYKFKGDKLIEIGLGYGIIGTNPMFQPE